MESSGSSDDSSDCSYDSIDSNGEVRWFDASARWYEFDRNDSSGHYQVLPPSTKTWTSTHSRCGCGGEDIIKLVIKGFGEDAPSTVVTPYGQDSRPTMISSGLTLWGPSDLLCNHLTTDEELQSSVRLLELGSGLGKCGLLAHHLLTSRRASTVLTDGDINALQFLRQNVARNIHRNDQAISCQQLIWGKKRAPDFLSQQGGRQFDTIIGSDLISGLGIIDKLFDTVDALLTRGGRFVLVHDESHGVRVETIVSSQWGANRVNMFHEVLKQDGQKHLLCFRRLTISNANWVMKRLQDTSAETRALRVEKGNIEEKCRCLEERFAAHVGGKNILSLGVDCIASVASFLGAQDLADVSSTCKQFGQKLHTIGIQPVSLWQMVAHRLFESASDREKESLPTYDQETSPLFFYNELVELRKPLGFDRLFGRNIGHAVDDPARIVNSNRIGKTRLDSRVGFSRRANTAVSNHVMRAGKHYVTFTCPEGPDETGNLLWFGIVRPLQSLGPRGKSLFTPFCSRFVNELNELRREEWGESAPFESADCCVYVASTDGECFYKDWSDSSSVNEVYNAAWQGMKPFAGRGKVGMLLDCDAGTLTVYLNGKRLGVMKEGLAGPYTWMVSVAEKNLLRIGVGLERAWGFDSDRDESGITPRKRGLAKISTND